MSIIQMISANHKLAERLSAQQIMTLFSDIRGNSVLLFDEAVRLIELFGVLCWQLENEKQQEDCFELLHDIVIKLPLQEKGKLASKLMEKSINYPRFVFLASELFTSLPPDKRKKMKLYPLNWTYTDEFTCISSGEYEWRKRKGLPCSMVEKCFHRPMSMLDLLCFEVSLQILYETGSETYIYIP